jgi:subtilisin family serine protease
MRKGLILTLGILTAMLVLWGCTKDMPTTSPSSNTVETVAKAGPMEVLVGYTGAAPIDAVKGAGGAVLREYKNIPVIFVTVPAGAIQGLRNNRNVLYVEENMTRTFVAQTLDWGVNRIDAEYVWTNSQYDGTGVDVAVLDSGGDMDHPDLTWAGGYSAVNNDPNNWDDKNGHGTHCAGIISADNNTIGVVGVAPNCDIYAVQASKSGLLSLADIIAGLDWIIGTHEDADPNNDIKVVSMSFSGGYSTAEEAALLEAYNHGILEIAAAGNASGAVEYPAALSFVVAISASTSTDAIASYSNFGPEIELIAPGSSILSTYKGGRYATMSGTSMACPMVAGAAVLAIQKYPNYTPDQIKTVLFNAAEDIGLSAYQQGHGLLDAEKAVLGTTNGNDF